MIYRLTDTTPASPLFHQWEETLIWSCLQGIMGSIYADDLRLPTAGAAVIGDFAFFAGKANRELVQFNSDWCTRNFMIMVPQNDSWLNLITEHYGEKAQIVSRYAIKKEPGVFSREKLEKTVVSLPEGYEISMIDERLYHLCLTEPWSADLVAQFPDYEHYRRLGLGAVICHDNIIVSGASSYSRYRQGIEIEIDTREQYRRKGLASICGARLILECLKRNLYPSWDAQNRASVALAEKLGYHYSHTYSAVEVRNLLQ